MMNKSPLERLQEIGFEIAGEWFLEDGEPRIELTRYDSAANVLYAFASEEELLYVGRSGRSLRARMDGYERGGPTNSMRTRNRERIAAMLMIDQNVDLYALPDPGNLHYGSFRVNLAAGLQHSLAQTLSPPWNSTRTEKPPERRAPRKRVRRHKVKLLDTQGETFTDLTTDRPSYRFLVGYHYFDKGFFNVPLRYSRLFGADQEKIRILCGRGRSTVHGHIDRTTNTNSAPRIIGGRKLKRWFEENTGLNKPVDIDILAPNAVWLRNPGTKI